MDVKGAWGHYIQVGDKKRYIRCLSVRDKKKNTILEKGLCCQKFEDDEEQRAQFTLAVLAVKYLNSDPITGKFKKNEDGTHDPIRWEIGWLKLSPSGFKEIGGLVLEGEKVYQFDVAMSMKSNGIGYQYKKVAANAVYRQIEGMAEEVRKAAEPFKDGKLLIKRLGKKITELELKALLAGKSAAQGASKNNDDIGDL